jgi:hypothetical protein
MSPQATEMGSCPRSVAKIRAELLGLGRLRDNKDGTLTLTEDVVFASPSQAANVVHGESKNGWLFWRLGDYRGPSLGEADQMGRRGEADLIYYEKPVEAVEIRSR